MNDKEAALLNLVKDMYKAECKKSMKYLITSYILAILLFLVAAFSAFLGYELSSYDTVTITETTTTETYTNSVDGDNANIVNDNQYNDNAVHNQ